MTSPYFHLQEVVPESEPGAMITNERMILRTMAYSTLDSARLVADRLSGSNQGLEYEIWHKDNHVETVTWGPEGPRVLSMEGGD